MSLGRQIVFNMASSSTTSVKSSDILTESDIPGAVLPQKIIELCSVVQLKRWLTCRGACTTGRKVELVSRLVEAFSQSFKIIKIIVSAKF